MITIEISKSDLEEFNTLFKNNKDSVHIVDTKRFDAGTEFYEILMDVGSNIIASLLIQFVSLLIKKNRKFKLKSKGKEVTGITEENLERKIFEITKDENRN